MYARIYLGSTCLPGDAQMWFSSNRNCGMRTDDFQGGKLTSVNNITFVFRLWISADSRWPNSTLMVTILGAWDPQLKPRPASVKPKQTGDFFTGFFPRFLREHLFFLNV